MTREDFTSALEQELHLQATPFCRDEVLSFVGALWSHMADDPDPTRWANIFLECWAEASLVGVGEPD
jgi:hypothetical protein